MSKIIILIALTFLEIKLTSCEGLRNWGYNERSNEEYGSLQSLLSSGGHLNEPTHIGLGLSAWGIVTVIVSLILAIVDRLH